MTSDELAERLRAPEVRLHADARRNDTAEHWLGELLAVIHRDGGHYAEQHGYHKATLDAMRIVHGMRQALLDENSVEGGRTA